MVKIAGISDLHGHLSHTIPKCDILAIVGDIVPLLSTAEDWKHWQEYDWLKNKFVKWLTKQMKNSECQYVVICPGNHDICFYSPETRREVKELLESIPGVILLDHDKTHVELLGLKISGWPYTPTIQQRTWAYSLPRGDARVKDLIDHYIQDDTDLLLTHGPPLGLLDGVDGSDKEAHVGCSVLMHKIIEVGPSVILCGHVHEARGKRVRYYDMQGREGKVINVSLCNRDYTVKGSKVQIVEMG